MEARQRFQLSELGSITLAMNRKHVALGCLGLWLSISPLIALVTEHKKEPVHVSSWSEPVDQLINHPARFEGRVGPFAPQAEFQYDGSPEVLNGLLAQYAKIPGRSSVIYLTTGPMTGPLAAHSDISGKISIWIRVTGVEDLKTWKIPAGLGVERLDVPGGLPHLHRSALEEAIGRFLRDHPVPPGAKDSPSNRRF